MINLDRPTTQRCEDYAPISEDGERMNKTQQHDHELIEQATPEGQRRRIAELEAEVERLSQYGPCACGYPAGRCKCEPDDSGGGE